MTPMNTTLRLVAKILTVVTLLLLVLSLHMLHAYIVRINMSKVGSEIYTKPQNKVYRIIGIAKMFKGNYNKLIYLTKIGHYVYVLDIGSNVRFAYNPQLQVVAIMLSAAPFMPFNKNETICGKARLVLLDADKLNIVKEVDLHPCFRVIVTKYDKYVSYEFILIDLRTLSIYQSWTRPISAYAYVYGTLIYANTRYVIVRSDWSLYYESVRYLSCDLLSHTCMPLAIVDEETNIVGQINDTLLVAGYILAPWQSIELLKINVKYGRVVKSIKEPINYLVPVRINNTFLILEIASERDLETSPYGVLTVYNVPFGVLAICSDNLTFVLQDLKHIAMVYPVYDVAERRVYLLAIEGEHTGGTWYKVNKVVLYVLHNCQVVKVSEFNFSPDYVRIKGYVTDIFVPIGIVNLWQLKTWYLPPDSVNYDFFIVINNSVVTFLTGLLPGSLPPSYPAYWSIYTTTSGKVVLVGRMLGTRSNELYFVNIMPMVYKTIPDAFVRFGISVSGLLNVSKLVNAVSDVGSVLFNVSELVPQLLILNPGLVNGLPLSGWNRTWWASIGWWSVASGVDHMHVRAIAIGNNSAEIIGSWHVLFGKRPWTWGVTDVALVMGVTVPLRKVVSLGDVYRLRMLILAGYGFSSVSYNPVSHEIGALLTVFIPVAGPVVAHWVVQHFPIFRTSMVRLMQLLEKDTASLPKVPTRTWVTVRERLLPNDEGIEYVINITTLFLPCNATAKTSQLPLPSGFKLPRFANPRQAVEWALRQNPSLLEWLMREKLNLLYGRWLYDFCLPRGISQEQCWGMFLDWWYRGGWQEAYEAIVSELEPTLGRALFRLSLESAEVSGIRISIRAILSTAVDVNTLVLIGLGIGEALSWVLAHPGLDVKNILGISLNVQTLGTYPSMVGLVTTEGKFPTWWYTLPPPDVRDYLWEIATGAPLVTNMPVSLLKKSIIKLANGQVAMYVAYVPKSPIAQALARLGRSLDDSYLTEVSFYVFRLVEFRQSFFQMWASAWGLTPEAWFSAWIYPYKIMIAVEKSPIKGAQEIANALNREAKLHGIPITIIPTGKSSSLVFRIVFPRPTKALPKWIADIFKGWLVKGTILFNIVKDYEATVNVYPWGTKYVFTINVPSFRNEQITLTTLELLLKFDPAIVLLETAKGAYIIYVNSTVSKLLKYNNAILITGLNASSIATIGGVLHKVTLFDVVYGKRYLFEMTRGGIKLLNMIFSTLPPNEKVRIVVFPRLPPDVGVGGVLFNGTEITSTVPHVATVVLFATVPESFVTLRVCAGGGYWTASGRYMNLGTFMCWNFTLHNVTAGIHLINVPIGQVIEEYYRKVQAVGMNGTYRMWVCVKAWIVDASMDEIKADNFAMNNCTFPVPYWKGNVTVLVHVLDAYTLRPIPRFYVWAMSIKYLKNITSTWGTNGVASLMLRYGVKYMVCAWASGYYRRCVQVMPLGVNWTVTILLYPKNRTVPTTQVVTPPAQGYATVVVHVMYEDGVPFQGAEVTILQNGAVVCSGYTDVRGVFMCHVKNMTLTTVKVVAKVDGVTYRYEKTIVPKTFAVLYFTVPVLSPTSTLGASATLLVKVYDSYSGKPLPNVTVILNGTLRTMTNASGIAVFKNLHVCNRANITVEAPSNYLNLVGYETVHIAKRVTLLNYPLCPSTYKPSAVTYMVTLVVRDKLDNPVVGALVKVLNAVSKSLIAEGYTTSSGLFRFVVPNDTLVNIMVRYGNVTLWINNTLVTKPLVVTVRLPVVAKVVKPPRYLQARIVVTALNMTSLEPVKNAVVTVVSLYRGYAYSNVTNSSGMAVFTVQRWHYYSISAVAGRYETPHTFTAYTCYRECRVWLPLEPTGVKYMYYGNGSAVLPMYRIGNVTYVPIIVQVSYRDGAPVQGLAVQYNATYDNASIVKTFVTDCLGRTYITVPLGSNVTIIIRNNSKTLWIIRLVKVNESLWIVKHLNVTSPWYRPEVAILSISVSKPRVDTVRMVPYVPYRLELWTNTPQRVKVRVCLIAVKTNSTITCKTLRLMLGRGLNVYYGSLYYVVTMPTPARAVATIVYAENDTYRWNNVAYSREILLTPYIDLALAVLVNVTRSPLPLIPIPQYSTLKITAIVSLHGKASKLTNTTLRLAVLCQLPWGAWTVYKNYTLAITHAPYVLNITLPTPWCVTVKIVGKLVYPYDIDLLNNNATTSLSIAPEVELVSARPSPRLPTYPSNMPFKIIIVVKTNDYNVPLFVQVKDTTTGKVLTFLNYTLLQNTTTYTFVIPVKVSAGLFAVAESHTLNVTIASPADTLHSNNYRAISITVTGMAVTIAGIFIGLLLLIILLLIILIIVIAIARRRRIRARTVGDYAGYV